MTHDDDLLLAPQELPASWTFDNPFGPPSALIVAGDKVIGAAGNNVFALDMNIRRDAKSGELGPRDWLYELDGLVSRDTRLTAADGVVYFMHGDALKAVRLATGVPIAAWNPAKGIANVRRIIAQSDRVVVVHLEKGATLVSGLKPGTGERTFGPMRISDKSPGPVAYGAKAVFFVAGNELKVVDSGFGDVRWTFAPDGDALKQTSEPVIASDVVLVSGSSLHGVTLEKGEPRFAIAPSPGENVTWKTPVISIPSRFQAAKKAANMKARRPLLGDAHGRKTLQAVIAETTGGTAIATNSAGDFVCVALATGATVWRKKLNDPGAPVLIGDVVYVSTNGGAEMGRFNAATGNPAGAPFLLQGIAKKIAPVIGNGNLVLAEKGDKISQRPFAIQEAAYFDGKTSMIQVEPDAAQFDFGTGDFTVEAWFRSSHGGDIVSSYPTNAVAGAHGFRINLEETGQLRVATIDVVNKTINAGRSASTGAADGEWHHVAFRRSKGDYMIVLDGQSQTVYFPPDQSGTALSIGGRSALTIGAYQPSRDIAPTSFFHGLIREVRIWDTALDIATISNNRRVEFTGREPRLKGLWRLSEDQTLVPAEPKNEAKRHAANARFTNKASRKTDLTMDYSAFPYLLEEGKAQWPYTGAWGARGILEATGASALSSDGIVAFSTESVIFAVGRNDGKRVWSMDINATSSDPVADGPSFLMVTDEESLIRIDSLTGGKVQVEAFADLPHHKNLVFPNPAVSDLHIAAASAGDDGTVMVAKRGETTVQTVALGAPVSSLTFVDVGLLALTTKGSVRTLHLIDPSTCKIRGSRAVSSDSLCAADRWIFVANGKEVEKIDVAHFATGSSVKSAAVAGNITGLIASGDDDWLIATTDAGTVHQMTIGTFIRGWDKTLPAADGASPGSANPPVLDPAGHIFCTSANGTVAALNGDTGALLGYYQLEQGAIGTPTLKAGSVFTACKDSGSAGQNIDGAMHSVVLGQSTAMRLNLDQYGRPVPQGAQHAVIEANGDDSTLHLIEVNESCVEAWVNVPVLSGAASQRGGGIFGMAPSGTSGFDLNLWIEADGTLHYTSRMKDVRGWNGLHVKAPTKVVDGKWHHVAAVRMSPADHAPPGSPDRVLLYVDGVLLNSTREENPAAPATVLESGLKAYIGAVAGDNLAAARPFCGMIADVRLWDTYLLQSEIAARMNVRLRGDEADLIAYWNFNLESVHDGARQGHDGRLAQPVTHPVWWLSPLSFVEPSYPYITSAAKITSPEGSTSTTYEMTLKVCNADGTAMKDADVHLWYVKRKPDDPATIIINSQQTAGVLPNEEEHPLLRAESFKKAYKAKTQSDGTLKVTVVTDKAGHGPAIDMWTGAFMPLNQRYHLSVLLDNQKLDKPAPPTLSAQAKLIQDYNYSQGNKIDHTRDRSTWRIVLRAADPGDSPRPREPITVWASQPVDIEVDGVSYKVNPDNSATLNAQSNGELTVVMSASDLTAATLYARAGFMHRHDRVVVNPDQDAHSKLNTVRDDELAEPRMTNWQKRDKQEEGSLLDGDYKAHAPEVGKAVRQVTSAVKPADPEPVVRSRRITPARRKLISMRAHSDHHHQTLMTAAERGEWRPIRLRAMAQPKGPEIVDAVVVRRTLAGAKRPAPVDVEAFRESLDGNVGFVFERKTRVGQDGKIVVEKGVRYRALATYADVDAEKRAGALLVARNNEVALANGIIVVADKPVQQLGGWWNDAWSAIEDTATSIYDAATKIVVTIADTITIAVTKLVNSVATTLNTVVSSVKDALNAVASFFEQLYVGIKKLIEFLRALFDWGNIIKTQQLLKKIIVTSMEITSKSIRNSTPLVNALKTLAATPLGSVPGDMKSLGTTSEEAGGKDDPAITNSNSVQGKQMMEKASQKPPASGRGTDPFAPKEEAQDPMDVFVKAIPKLADSILDLSPADLVQTMKDLVAGIISATLTTAATALAAAMAKFADAIEWVVQKLDTPIYIPFISELFEWVTSQKLTVLNVLCLVLAIPVNIVYALLTLMTTGSAGFFFNDAQNVPDVMRRNAGLAVKALGGTAESEELMAAPLTVTETPRSGEIGFVVTRAITMLSDLIGDMAFIGVYVVGEVPEGDLQGAGMAQLNAYQAVFGLTSLSLQTFLSQPAYETRLAEVTGKDADIFLPPTKIHIYILYSLQMILRAAKAYSALSYVVSGPATPGPISRLKRKYQFSVTMLVGAAAYCAMVYQITTLCVNLPLLRKKGNDNVTMQYLLFNTRDIIALSAVMLEFMFTEEGAETIRRAFPGAAKYLYGAAYVFRHYGGLAGVALHSVAVFQYGD